MVGAVIILILNNLQWVGFTVILFGFHALSWPKVLAHNIVSVYSWEALYPAIPAVVVHLWLPVLLAATLLIKLMSWFFTAAKWMQWFLKQGAAILSARWAMYSPSSYSSQ
jgi:hypothetical protein